MPTIFFPWKPNAGAHLLPEAVATQERRLEAVRCSALFGAELVGSLLPAGVPSPHERPMTQDCAADNCSGPVISACDVLAQSHRSSRGCFSEGRRQESPT